MAAPGASAPLPRGADEMYPKVFAPVNTLTDQITDRSSGRGGGSVGLLTQRFAARARAVRGFESLRPV